MENIEEPCGSCMECDWSGLLKDCDTDYDYDEFWGRDIPYLICPECSGAIDYDN